MAGQPAHSHRLGIRQVVVKSKNTGNVASKIPPATPKVVGLNELSTAAYTVRPPAITVAKYAFGMAWLGSAIAKNLSTISEIG